MPEQAAEAIAAYSPRSTSAGVAALARRAVSRAAPRTPTRARALLYAASRIGAFADSTGLSLEPERILCEAVIERFCLSEARTVSPATLRTLRCNLRFLARSLEPGERPAPARLPRERAKAPYSEAEIAGYLALAERQSTEAQRMRARALICLGAGAGIIGSELRGLRGSDVIARSGGLVVEVKGPRARAVPVISRYREGLAEAAAFAGERYLIGGEREERRNLSEALNRALSADRSLPRLEPGRLRATWLSECAEAIGLRAFMAAAGIRCSQRLGDIAAELAEVAEPEAMRLLGGADETE